MRYAICLFAIVLAAAPLSAQNPGDPVPGRLWPQLVKYLELTPQQVLSLGRIELEWQRYLAGKTRRAAQVQREIRDATLAEFVDPVALGMGYRELEAICRESRDMDRTIQGEARKVLTQPQMTRLAALEQAYRLLPLIAEADAANLMDAPLPGLSLSALGAGAASRYPGCLFPARQAAEGAQSGDPAR